MRSIVLLLSALLIASATGFADETAVSSSGKIVLLKDDGTWVEKPTQQSGGGVDFRSTSWGMTKAQVIQAEKLSSNDIKYQGDSQIGVEYTVSGYECRTYYVFAAGKLVRAIYDFQIKHANDTDFVTTDFPKIKGILSAKYGDPSIDTKNWKNDLYKDDPQHWGTAVGMGHLEFYSQWKTSTTTITEFLKGDNFDVTFGVEYASISLGALEDKQTSEKATSEF
jgi:hypothetical protein